MSPAVLGALVAVGGLVGFVSGLVGIGGGVLIVPFLYFFYAAGWAVGEVPLATQTTVAHATSLFIILPTALLGVYTYHRASLVAWRAAVPVGAFAVLGALVGARVALLLPPALLRLGFGLFLVASGVQLLRGRGGAEERPLRTGLLVTAPVGLAVGLLSAMMGVGGGILAIPLLLHLVHLDLRRVAATSLAVIAFAAVSGTVSYAVATPPAGVVLPGAVGYVHLAAAAPMLVGSLSAVRWGARVNQRTGTRTLRLIFAVLFLLLGVRLIANNAGAFF